MDVAVPTRHVLELGGRSRGDGGENNRVSLRRDEAVRS